MAIQPTPRHIRKLAGIGEAAGIAHLGHEVGELVAHVDVDGGINGDKKDENDIARSPAESDTVPEWALWERAVCALWEVAIMASNVHQGRHEGGKGDPGKVGVVAVGPETVLIRRGADMEDCEGRV